MLFGRILRRILPTVSELAATVAHRTYIADGLITRHTADFRHDEKFLSAYAMGKATGSWMHMDPQWRVYTACWAARHALALPGDFVECGVNRGGMALTIIEYLDFKTIAKRFFLLDTYSGFPAGAVAASANRHLYADCYADVIRTFTPYPNAIVVRGVVPHSLSAIDSERIAYLSIDMNNPEPEVAAVERLWPRMAPGAVVLLDDYAGGPAYDRQKRAFDALAKKVGFQILSLPTGQGLIVKTP